MQKKLYMSLWVYVCNVLGACCCVSCLYVSVSMSMCSCLPSMYIYIHTYIKLLPASDLHVPCYGLTTFMGRKGWNDSWSALCV